MKHVQPTPWCFLGTLATNCNGAGPLYSCPDSTVWPNPAIPCHATIATPPVPQTGVDGLRVALGAGDFLLGIVLVLALVRQWL